MTETNDNTPKAELEPAVTGNRAADVIQGFSDVAGVLRCHAAAIRKKAEDLATYAEKLADGAEARARSFVDMTDQYSSFAEKQFAIFDEEARKLAELDGLEEPPRPSPLVKLEGVLSEIGHSGNGPSAA